MPALEHGMVNGKPATIAYFNDAFELVGKQDATLIKAVLDHSGQTIWLLPS